MFEVISTADTAAAAAKYAN